MKILHLPTTVGGHSSGLSKELNSRGISSQVWTLNQNYLEYEVDKSITKRSDSPFLRILKIIFSGSYVWKDWDVVHFNSGSTLFSVRFSNFNRRSLQGIAKVCINWLVSVMQKLELSILKMRGVKLFVHYQGDDARQGDYSLENYEFSIATQVEDDYYTVETDKFKRNQIALMDAYCEKIYAVNPDLLNVLPPRSEFVPYSHVNLNDWVPNFNQQDQVPLRILHAPSNRAVKGTDQILEALSSLSANYDFELMLVEGISNQEAKDLYRNCDIVIDQLYAGWYGGVAVEAMALGKPVMAYIREEDLRYIPAAMKLELPIIRTSPMTFSEDIKRVLDMSKADLIQLAHKSRQFVEKWHNPYRITDKLISDYEEALNSR